MEDIRLEFGRAGEGAFFREGEGLGDFAVNGALDRAPGVAAQHSADTGDFVALDPFVELGIGTVLPAPILVRTDMIAPTIRHAFDEAWPAAGANIVDSLFAGRADLEGIAILDLLCRNLEHARAFARIGLRHSIPDMRINRVMIVLANEQDRQFPQCGEVQALIRDAFIHRAFAEERNDNGFAFARFEREGIANRLRNRRRDDGRRTHHAGADVDEVHRPGFASGAAVALPVEFGNHALEVAAFRKIKRVAAIGAEGDVARLEHTADADRNGFLSNRKMHRALDDVAWVDLDDLFLDPPNSVEAAIDGF